jgi:hypothetical protein
MLISISVVVFSVKYNVIVATLFPQANTQKNSIKNDFHTLQGTTFHRLLTNSPSLKITAAYYPQSFFTAGFWTDI